MSYADVMFEHSPDGPREVSLTKRSYMVEEGFGAHVTTYPVTICPARYGGTYEGGPWLAFPVQPEILANLAWEDWNGSDIECTQWWARAAAEGWPVGRGDAPDLAYRDLIRIAAAKAEVDVSGWDEPPTWDREELKKRNDDAG